ncbi:MAG: 2-hydroxyacyl-CoA dehydratase [Dethiobacter sp.]|jgi:benzoyl-CoA reductase/2-hydroxyglutaryl-CoA dehydratase subunit BcrC/BadD/HgdB|nr:2-hydroxyacyl-CoA dehydratase [Dethiobacter sp.]
MAESFSEMSRAVRSLDAVKSSKKMLPKFYMRAQNRKDSGGPLAWCMAGIPPELLQVFDLNAEWPENFSTMCAARLVAPGFIEIAEAEGYSGELCSYLTNTMGYCKRTLDLSAPPPESPLEGGMGVPTMLLGSGYGCDPRWKWFQAIATRYFDVPIFSTDPMSPPFDIDVNDPRVAEHYTQQYSADINAQIAFLEKHTGKIFDPDRFRTIMANSQKAIKIWHEILDMRKAKPCPMGAGDYFSAIIPQMYMLGEEETINYYQAIHDEVKKRVENGIGVIANEKYRLFWTGLPPWFNLGLFNYLESLGAVVVIEASYYCGPMEEVNLDDPLEGLVQRIWKKTCWRHSRRTEAAPEVCNHGVFGPLGSLGLLNWVKEYDLDGALMHRNRSCRATSLGQVHYSNVLNEVGIPTLILESDMADPRAWSDSRIKAQVEAFLEVIDNSRKRG